DDNFKFQAMIPLDAAPTGTVDLGPDAKIGETPAGRAIKFQHRGAYDDVDSTYEAITAYLDEKGYDAQNVFVEEYLNDPKGSDDTALALDIYVFVK
ncbi:MAG: GyrI-like domain-containing protein, partial [Hyphomicrobiales bacterium]|nr:GyrI-like domain-containing protein [Hyphomicrobiales bacterium]